MHLQTAAGHRENAEWLTQSLRLTAFPSPSAQIPQGLSWEGLVGHPPENVIARPREGAKMEQGPFEGAILSLSVEPVRIDWSITPMDEAISLGPFAEILEPFRQLMLRWLQLSPPLQRLAFGAVLRIPVNDRQTAYERLAHYVPSVRLDPTNSSDFLYQINRPRASLSGVPNLALNRLSKWSAARRTRVNIQIGAISAPRVFLPTLEDLSVALELDLNTSPEFQGDLPQEMLPRIFQELVDLGTEIAREGDIP